MVLFSEAYESVESGYFAILQNKFSKSFDPEVYYSGRYYTGIAKRFIKYPLKYQTIVFSNRRPNADSTPIQSTTSSGSVISISCLVQYAIRPEKIHDIYIKWPSIDRLKTDMKTTVKQKVTSIINQYSPSDFRLSRSEINRRMSYEIGTAFKQNFFCDMNVFTISEVILEEKDVQGFLNSKLTEKSTLKIAQTTQVNQILSNITGVQAEAALNVSVIQSQSQSNATKIYLDLISTADSYYYSNISSSLTTLKTGMGLVDQKEFVSFMYLLSLITERKAGTLRVGYD